MVYANELTFCLYSFTSHFIFHSIAETDKSFRFSKLSKYNIKYSKPILIFQTSDVVKLYPISEQNCMPERPKPGFLLIMWNVLSWGQLSALA